MGGRERVGVSFALILMSLKVVYVMEEVDNVSLGYLRLGTDMKLRVPFTLETDSRFKGLRQNMQACCQRLEQQQYIDARIDSIILQVYKKPVLF